LHATAMIEANRTAWLLNWLRAYNYAYVPSGSLASGTLTEAVLIEWMYCLV